MKIDIDRVHLRPGGDDDRRRGLLGYLTFVINGALRVDGVTLRRTAGGELALSFPARRDRQGRDHPLLFPIDDPTRLEIERQVLGRVRAQLGEGAPSDGR